jgi:formamidopyrimidine-DNA glycosylase
MPELPEVETVVRDLRPLLVGRRLGAAVVGGKLRRPWSGDVSGAVVQALRRRGKWIVAELEPEGRLVVHLGMTGQLTVVGGGEAVADHVHVRFPLDDGRELRFRDVRRFGSVELFPDEAAVTAFLGERLGPEPDELEAEAFAAAVRGSKRPVKATLLDQTVVAGVGNIYADEALHRAGLHPERRGPTLTPAECERLRLAVAEVIAFAIEHRGSSIRDYIGGSGLRGEFQHEHRAYGRGGQPCLTCETAIRVVRVGGRSSHFCPQCQT